MKDLKLEVNVDVRFNKTEGRYIFLAVDNYNSFCSYEQIEEYYYTIKHVLPKLEPLIFLYQDILKVKYNVFHKWRLSDDIKSTIKNIKRRLDKLNKSSDKEIYFDKDNQEFAYKIAIRDTCFYFPEEAKSIPDVLIFKDKIEFEPIYEFIKDYGGKTVLYRMELKEIIKENNVKCVIHIDINFDNECLDIVYFSSLSKSAKPKQLSLPLNLKAEIKYFEENVTQEYSRVDTDKSIKINFKDYMLNCLVNYLSTILKKSYNNTEYTFISTVDIRNKVYSMFLNQKNKNYETYKYIADMVRMFYNKYTIKINRYEDSPEKVFDYIIVDLNVNSIGKSREEVFDIVQKNSKFLQKRALKIVKNSKKFQKYGVPIEYLKIRDIYYTQDNVLSITLDLKKEELQEG